MNYGILLAELGFSEALIAAHEGKLPVPRFTLAAPSRRHYGFPPIMVPIWSIPGLPGYIGVVTSWFGGDEYGYIKYYSGEPYASEIAKSFKQLAAWLTFDFHCNVPDPAEVGEFAEAIGLCKKDEVDQYFVDIQSKNDLVKLPVFAADLPNYLGKGEENSCPNWVVPNVSSAEVFSQIEGGNYHLAWCGINSPGLEREEIVQLLDKIAPFAEDDRFADLVKCWKLSA